MEGQLYANTNSNPPASSPPPPVATPPPSVPPMYEPEGSKKRIVFIISGILMFLMIAIAVIIGVLWVRNQSPKEPENVTLTYWGLWEDESVYSDVISSFQKQYPYITVKYEKQDIKTIGKYIDRLSTRINKGTGPDIFRFHNAWLSQVQPYLSPLPDSVLKETQFKEQYFNVVKDDVSSKGAYYGLPLGIDTLALFINNDIFQAAGKQPPSTWEDLVKVSRELTVVDGETGSIQTAGVALGTYDNIAHAPDIVSLLLIQNGADLYNLDGERKINAEQALEFYLSFAKGDNTVWNNDMDNSKLAFAKGNLAMYFGYSWDSLEIQGINPELRYTIVPVPHLPGRTETLASYWVEGVSAKSTHSSEAFLFLQYLAKRESLEKIFTAQSKSRRIGVPYPRRDMAALLKSNQLLYPFVEQADTAKSSIFMSDTYDDGVTSALNIYLGNAVRSMQDNTSAQTAVETLANGVSQVLGSGGVQAQTVVKPTESTPQKEAAASP